MKDWSTIMINAAAEMRSKNEEEVLQAVIKESGAKRAEVVASLENKPDYAKRSALIIMLAQTRYRSD